VELLWNKFNVVLFSKTVSRWIFVYAYFAFDNVLLKIKNVEKIKNVKKRKKRDLNKKRKKRLLQLWLKK